MKYKTHDSIEFSIPDTWLAEFGLTERTLDDDHFVSDDAEKAIGIRLINSPVRGPGVRWLHYESMRYLAPIRFPPESASNQDRRTASRGPEPRTS